MYAKNPPYKKEEEEPPKMTNADLKVPMSNFVSNALVPTKKRES